jgi:predicted amidohydrolase YtcJ
MIENTVIRLGSLLLLACGIGAAQRADTVLLGGKILVLDAAGRTVQALAIRGGRIVAVGSDAQMRAYTGKTTKVIPLDGKMVVPGLIESHVHALGAAREEHDQPYAELSSIPEIQAWIRRRAEQLPPGAWIRVPRNDVTRLKERRHPTPAELDAACTTHPVIFTAVMKNTFNTAGWRALGITPETKEFHGGHVVRDTAGAPDLLVGADTYIQSTIAAPKLTNSQMLEELPKILSKYSEVGITAIGERRSNVEGFRTYQELEKLGRLPVRATVAINLPERTPEKIEEYVRKIGVKQGDGDDWVKVGILKLAADGGIHWGTTALREPYGLKRMHFYRLTDPNYRGFYYNTDQEMRDIVETANRIGWQIGIHATGDAAVEQVLNAVEAADRKQSVRPRRFTLIHAYFPAPDLIARAQRLGMCVDTQPILYYKDSDAIAEVYGQKWAERFIGVGDWVRAGIPTAINSDHMIGLDPNHAMNSYNPFLAMYIAVTRKNQNGRTYGPEQRISRIAALRAMTSSAAYLDFNENKIGSLEVGKFADLAVLDRDYLTCSEEEIRAIKVLMTMVNGKLVYQRTLTASAR